MLEIWVKPEVDPPRDERAAAWFVKFGRGIVLACPIFNHEWLKFSRIGSGFAEKSACWFYSCSLGVFVVQGHPSRMGGRRGLVIDEVAQAIGGIWTVLKRGGVREWFHGFRA